MKQTEELAYYNWLEDVIRDRKRASVYFSNQNAEERDADIMLLTEQIVAKHPEVLDKLLAGTVDATGRHDISPKNILDFLGTTEKGTAVTWRDKNGNELLFVNAGKGSAFGKKRIVVLDDSFSGNDIQNLKKNLLRELFRRDVEKIYDKIEAAERERQRQEKKEKTFLSAFISGVNPLQNTAGEFERNFKTLIRKQGYGASSAATVSAMVSTMSGGEVRKLNRTLAAMGVRSGEDFQNLLSRWRTEALEENIRQPQRAKVKIRHRMSRGEEMSIGM